MDTFFDLFTRPEFRLGLVGGVVGTVILAGSLAVKDLSRRLPGAVSILVLLTVIFVDLGQRASIAAGVMAMAFAGFLWQRSRYIAIAAATLGASLLMYRGGISDNADWWVRPTGVAIILFVGWSVLRWEGGGNRPSLIVLFAITLLGIWATVPETRVPRLFLGSWTGLLPGFVLLGIPHLGRWAPAIAAPIVWMAAEGGTSRPGSIIGGWASFGILLLQTGPSLRVWRTCLVHSGLVLIAARVAGLRESPIEAALISLTAFAMAAAYLLWTGNEKPSPPTYQQ